MGAGGTPPPRFHFPGGGGGRLPVPLPVVPVLELPVFEPGVVLLLVLEPGVVPTLELLLPRPPVDPDVTELLVEPPVTELTPPVVEPVPDWPVVLEEVDQFWSEPPERSAWRACCRACCAAWRSPRCNAWSNCDSERSTCCWLFWALACCSVWSAWLRACSALLRSFCCIAVRASCSCCRRSRRAWRCRSRSMSRT